MISFFDTFPTPFGRFSVAVDADGAIVATAFGGADALRRRLRPGVGDTLVADKTRTAQARAELLDYAAGRRERFSVRLRPRGTPFQLRVWKALQGIPFGEVRSYGEIAAALRTAPRAVGRANALNPICLVVPCHRVVGADRSLTGFAFGVRLKQRLLAHEAAPQAAR